MGKVSESSARIRVDDSPASLAEMAKAVREGQGILESPEVLQQTPVSQAASDFNNPGRKRVPEPVVETDTKVVINDPAFTRLLKLKFIKIKTEIGNH